jgi:hypothetical protein
MPFHWIALIAMWTVIAGPIFSVPITKTPTQSSGMTQKSQTANQQVRASR